MKKDLQSKVSELTAKAKQGGGKVTSSASHNRSSLHKVIKTKEQADAFMKLLQSS